ncbi:class I SAM-dependent methyltransferase [Microbacterium rhizomatis]|uniref:class I SAM-dependent methyltransferase n=1 Tax=Microbacterium rhizomatis TaxID=1631477 RepID=UPI001B85DA1B|nr:class I SAM-dependent methyltransferase [Microbacterium rhizomatis]
MSSDVESAYSARAADYVEQLGSVDSLHPSDRALIKSWAAQVDGPIVDAGCGPGHWSAYLAEHGHDIRGVDQVPEFVDHARRTYPHISFELGSLDRLRDSSGSVGGILAWYSLIHHEPSTVRTALEGFARVMRPNGSVLVGFFIGAQVEPFDHAVVTAYRWSAEALSNELRAAGFEVIETHTRIGRNPKPRPHGAIIAQLAPTN